ncbi:hypothetical protein GQX74_010151, partial [Glossina fuscipes]
SLTTATVEVFGLQSLQLTPNFITIVCLIANVVKTLISMEYNPGGTTKNKPSEQIRLRRCMSSSIMGAIPYPQAIRLFGCTHWQTYISGALRFGKIDMHLMSIVFNPEFWLTKLRYLGFEVRIIPLHFTLGIDLLLATRYVKVINKKVCDTNGSAVAGTSVLSPSISLMLMISPAFIIAEKSPENISVYL